MTKAKIIVHFDSLEDAEDKRDDIYQVTMCRNPLDEPHIEIVEDKTEEALNRQHFIECLTLLQKRCKDADYHLLLGAEGWDFVDDWQTADEANFDESLDGLVDDILITGVFEQLDTTP